jgi:hypothetical protein
MPRSCGLQEGFLKDIDLHSSTKGAEGNEFLVRLQLIWHEELDNLSKTAAWNLASMSM